jgi:hypothetical protein
MTNTYQNLRVTIKKAFLWKWNFLCLTMGLYTGFIYRDEAFYPNLTRLDDINEERIRSARILELQEKKIDLAILQKQKLMKKKSKPQHI